MQQKIILIILLEKLVYSKRIGILLLKKKVISTHPPLEEITIIVQGTEVIVSPFKKINPKEEANRNSNLKYIKGIQ